MTGDDATIRRIRRAAGAAGVGRDPDGRIGLARIRAAAGPEIAERERRYQEAERMAKGGVSPTWRRIELVQRHPVQPRQVPSPQRRKPASPISSGPGIARKAKDSAASGPIPAIALLAKAIRKPAIEAPLDLATMPALTRGFALRDALAGAVRAGRVQATPRALAAFAQAKARLDPDEAAEAVEQFLASVQHHRRLRRRMKV